MFKLTRTKDGQQNNIFTMPLLPLRDIVVFPSMVVPLFVGREKSISALEAAMRTDPHKEVLLSAQRRPSSVSDALTIRAPRSIARSVGC